jgi:2-C-methyl-D-erythritol 4-phosphate cytidylyltransferase
MSVCIIIPACGVGSRFGTSTPKQFVELFGQPIIYHTIHLFDDIDSVKSIIVPVQTQWKDLVSNCKSKKEIILAKAGKERQDSVHNALSIAKYLDVDYILIHDAVRPCASFNLINKIIQATIDFGAAIPGITPKDTIKITNENSFVSKTLYRPSLKAIQTPQGFRKEIIIKAYQKADELGFYGTDDAYLVEQAGFPIKIIEGDELNIKITSKEDLLFCEKIILNNSK